RDHPPQPDDAPPAPSDRADSRPARLDSAAGQAARRHPRAADDRHVWRRAMEAELGPVVVACGDEPIAAAVREAGGTAVMTRADHPSGSDRIFEALTAIDPDGRHDAIVNVQGDLPTIARATIRASLDPLETDAVDIATLAVEITREEEKTAPH